MISSKDADLYAAIGVALACLSKHHGEPLVDGAAKVLSDFIRDEEARSHAQESSAQPNPIAILRKAMTDANVQDETRASLVGHFSFHWNAALAGKEAA